MFRVFLTCLLVMLASVYGASAKKLALVIGIDKYDTLPDLEKAVQDATGYRDLFAENGFDVTFLQDAGMGELNFAFAVFLSKIEPGDTVIFAYSGHGWSDGKLNYLLPADLPKQHDAVQTANLSIVVKDGVSGIIDKISARGADLTLAIIDACRDNPFLNANVRSLGLRGGLSHMEAPSGTFIVYSAAAKQTALDQIGDNDSTQYSVFTRYFIPNLRETGDIRAAVLRTRKAVLAAAESIGHNQRPAYYDELTSNSCLFSNCQPEGAAPQQAEPDPVESAKGLWDFIKSSDDPRTLKNFHELYADVVPNLAKKALRRATALEAAARAAEARRQEAIDAARREGREEPDPEPEPAPKPDPKVDDRPNPMANIFKNYGDKGGYAPDPVTPPTVLSWVTRSTGNRDIQACDRLATHPENEDNPSRFNGGFAVVSDVDATVEICARALKNYPKNPRMMYHLARALYWRRGPGDWDAAHEALTEAATLRYPPALMMLGNLNYFGHGVPRNHTNALQFYQLAAERGHAIAGAALAYMSFMGQGLDAPDPFRGIAFLKPASENPTPTARAYLGAIGLYSADFEIDANLAVSILESGGVAGHYLAYDLLGEAFEHGTPRAKKDVARALGYFRRAANLGSPTANAKLGFYYANGWGVPRDMATAVRFYRQGAERNDPVSNLELGKLYRTGEGVGQDFKRAAEYYLRASQLGSIEAPALLAQLHERGLGVDRSNYMAAAFMLLSLERGNAFLLNQPESTVSRGLVLEMQRQLRSMEVYSGPVDGTLNRHMQTALREYCHCG